MNDKIRELVRYKDLIFNLTKKELKLKYKNSILGFIWSFINPLMMLFIYSFAFKVILKIPIENFPLFVFTGLLPWMFFQGSITQSTDSIINNNNLIQKVYFPREVLPISIVLANFINFLITLLILLFVLVFNNLSFGVGLFLLPVLLIINLLFTLGISFFLSSLTVKYRDISHLIQVLFMVWFYLTPIIYPLDMVPSHYKTIILINPMTSLIEMYRNILLDGLIPKIDIMVIGIFYSVIVFYLGWLIFNVREKKFTEEI